MTKPAQRAKRHTDELPQTETDDAASPAQDRSVVTRKLPAVPDAMEGDGAADVAEMAGPAMEKPRDLGTGMLPDVVPLESMGGSADTRTGLTGSMDASSLLDGGLGDDLVAAMAQATPPAGQSIPGPRKPTLTAALDRATSGPRHEVGESVSTPPAVTLPPPPAFPPLAATTAAPAQASTIGNGMGDDIGDELGYAMDDEIEDEIADEADEWSVADQPTVVMSPAAIRRRKPQYLETGKQHAVWPAPAAPDSRPRDFGRPDMAADELRPSNLNGPRLAAPDGRLAPNTPPQGVPRAALSNPRMHRFQELRRQRLSLEQGEHVAEDATIAEQVRQWWSDLQPGLRRALHYQHEARRSGIHPIPAYAEPIVPSRLGDAFGRITATARDLTETARDLTERATAAAAPHIKRLHDAAEQRAQAVVQKIEGDPIRQQGPLLGPGRIAVFFRPAVKVGQAQRLLSATQARPLRIIPKRHGFLALVRPGTEAEVAERLRHHPYIADVVYLEYDEYGDPIQAAGA